MSESDQISGKGQPLEELGSELKREREVRDVSLREIAEDTKVSRRFLEAIEQGDHSMLPAPVFTRGFIHEYATFLGLDADAMVDRYLSQVKVQRGIVDPDVGPEKIPLLPGSTWLRLGLIALAIIVITGILLYFFMPESNPDAMEPPPAVEQTSEPEASADAPEDSAEEPSDEDSSDGTESSATE